VSNDNRKSGSPAKQYAIGKAIDKLRKNAKNEILISNALFTNKNKNNDFSYFIVFNNIN